MSNELESHTLNLNNQVNLIFNEIHLIIDKLPVGQKVFVKQICAEIGPKLNPVKEYAELYPLVKMFLHNCPVVKVTPGKFGGVLKVR